MYIALGLNPVLDIIFSDQTKTVDHRSFYDSLDYSTGGFGLNAARALKCLGNSPLCLFFAGGVAGTLLTSQLTKEGLRFESFHLGYESRVAATCLGSGQPRMSVSPSPALTSSQVDAIFERTLEISTVHDVILVGGSVHPTNEGRYFNWLRTLCNERRCCCDIRTTRVADILAARPFVLRLPSQPGEIVEPRARLTQLQCATREGVFLAIHSLAPRRLLAASREGLLQGTAPRLRAVNSFGAGDCLMAALAHYLCTGHSIMSAVQCSMAAASASVLTAIPGFFNTLKARDLESRVTIQTLAQATS